MVRTDTTLLCAVCVMLAGRKNDLPHINSGFHAALKDSFGANSEVGSCFGTRKLPGSKSASPHMLVWECLSHLRRLPVCLAEITLPHLIYTIEREEKKMQNVSQVHKSGSEGIYTVGLF